MKIASQSWINQSEYVRSVCSLALRMRLSHNIECNPSVVLHSMAVMYLELCGKALHSMHSIATYSIDIYVLYFTTCIA